MTLAVAAPRGVVAVLRDVGGRAPSATLTALLGPSGAGGRLAGGGGPGPMKNFHHHQKGEDGLHCLEGGYGRKTGGIGREESPARFDMPLA